MNFDEATQQYRQATPPAAPKPNFWQILLVTLGVLLVVGLVAGSGKKSPTVPTRTTLSQWCQTHAEDEWSGEWDSTTERYFRECTDY